MDPNDSDVLLPRGRQESGAFVHKDQTTAESVFYRTVGEKAGELVVFIMYLFVFGFIGVAIWAAYDLAKDK